MYKEDDLYLSKQKDQTAFVSLLQLKMLMLLVLFPRNRDIIDEENPYDAVTIEEDTKIYEDLVSYQKVVPVRLH